MILWFPYPTVNRSISTENWDKHKPPCKRWGTITTHFTCFITVCPIPSPYLSSLPFFHCYFHHLCLSRNYYKLISCKWSRLQTWEGLVLGANQLSLICTLPVIPLLLRIDCQEVKVIPWANRGTNVMFLSPSFLLKAGIDLTPMSYGKWMCLVTSLILKVFVMSQTLCKASDPHSLGEEREHFSQETTHLGNGDLRSSSLIYKWRESNSTLSCNNYFTLILILFVGKHLNLNLVYTSTSNLNVSRKNVLLARSVWANYCFYPTITQPALSLVSSMKIAVILHTITIFYVLLYL